MTITLSITATARTREQIAQIISMAAVHLGDAIQWDTPQPQADGWRVVGHVARTPPDREDQNAA